MVKEIKELINTSVEKIEKGFEEAAAASTSLSNQSNRFAHTVNFFKV